MLFVPRYEGNGPEPRKDTAPPTWADVRTCAAALKAAGAPPEEVFRRLSDFGLEEEVALGLVNELFPAKGKKGKPRRHQRPGTPPEKARPSGTPSRGPEGQQRPPSMPRKGHPCDHCGQPIPALQGEERIKSETEVVGGVAHSRTVRVVLCSECASAYDGTGDHLLRALLFSALAFMLLGCGGWLLSLGKGR
jgi:hypothetical protein